MQPRVIKSERYRGVAFLIVSSAILLAGCGGGSATRTASSPSVAPSTSAGFAISPVSISVAAGATTEFVSTKPATWRIQESGAGTIATEDAKHSRFSAEKSGVFHLIAAESDNSSVTATATVTVAPVMLSNAGQLATARLAHTASLLPSGKVLVAGGGYGPDMIDGFWVVSAAELIDPATGSITPAGSIARDQHTATLLRDGTVLLTGGEIDWGGNPPFPVLANNGTIYDPATGSTSTTGLMVAQRENHTATLLADGRVLIAGDGPSAEIYDPSTRKFTPTGNMAVARMFHTATLLSDGRILITGGDNQYNNVGQITDGGRAEIYDPRTGIFTATGKMSMPRAFHAATLLANGKVLITGGSKDPRAEIYDPATGTFAPTGSMLLARTFHTATLMPDGTVLIAGGLGPGGTGDINLIESYDPVSGAFSPAALMLQSRFWHTATLLPDGSVLFVGGGSSSDGMFVRALTSVEKYH